MHLLSSQGGQGKGGKKRRIRHMGTPRIFWFKARSRKLLFLHGSPAWVIQKTMPWLAEKLFKLSADERFIEYPYVHAVIGLGRKQKILDVGCCGSQLPVELASMGHEVYGIDVLEYPLEHPNLTSVQGDICRAPFPDGSFDVVTAISTLEHIGMNNTAFYSEDKRWQEFKPDDYPQVIREFRRLLRPGGRLFITVPYGRYKNHDWLQQFDDRMVTTVLDIFGGATSRVTYYRYYAGGWQLADAAACEDSSYFDIHKGSEYEPDYVAAARSVACLEMVK